MTDSDPIVTRFAPSPTGELHVGHAYSALMAHEAAIEAGGRFLLRIENIDITRCRPEYEEAIFRDLAWLGIRWETPVRRQSEHFDDYRAALAQLDEMGVIYPCFCTRAEIAAEIARSPSAPHGPEGPLYPGTCRTLDAAERARRIAAGEPYALRLDVAAAVARVGSALNWHDRHAGKVIAQPESLGDVVLARKDVPTSYHLAVTVDDHLQGVTLVVRGEDLVRGDAPPSPVAGIARLPDARLCPSPVAARRGRQTLRQAQQGCFAPCTSRARCDARGAQGGVAGGPICDSRLVSMTGQITPRGFPPA